MSLVDTAEIEVTKTQAIIRFQDGWEVSMDRVSFVNDLSKYDLATVEKQQTLKSISMLFDFEFDPPHFIVKTASKPRGRIRKGTLELLFNIARSEKLSRVVRFSNCEGCGRHP